MILSNMWEENEYVLNHGQNYKDPGPLNTRISFMHLYCTVKFCHSLADRSLLMNFFLHALYAYSLALPMEAPLPVMIKVNTPASASRLLLA